EVLDAGAGRPAADDVARRRLERTAAGDAGGGGSRHQRKAGKHDDRRPDHDREPSSSSYRASRHASAAFIPFSATICSNSRCSEDGAELTIAARSRLAWIAARAPIAS